MQLAGPSVFGQPKDRDEAVAVLREAVDRGITHIDTSDFYGPAVVNELIREALSPYPAGLRIVTKVGARRGADGSWLPAPDSESLIAADLALPADATTELDTVGHSTDPGQDN